MVVRCGPGCGGARRTTFLLTQLLGGRVRGEGWGLICEDGVGQREGYWEGVREGGRLVIGEERSR